MSMSFKILAIDGGGIRGVMPAAFLHAIERDLAAPIHKYFDLIVGTSTGGIIALALAHGIPAETILRLYREKGSEIFKRRIDLMPKMLASCVLGSVYRSKPLQQELRSVFGDDTLIGDAVCRVCIPAISVTTGNITVFKTRHHEDFFRDRKLQTWRVAAATAAAPIYFRPAKIPDVGWFIDGGLWANSPGLVGVAEACKLGYSLNDIQLLSIGTGTSPIHIDGAPKRGPLDHRRFRLLGSRKKLLKLAMRAQVQRGENYARYFLPASNVRRIEFELTPDAQDLDAVHLTEDLACRAAEQAKCLGKTVRSEFFSDPVRPFEPVPYQPKPQE